jgi:hypothetical protein
MRPSGAMLAAALLLSGCADSTSGSGPASSEHGGPCGSDLLSQPAEIVSAPRVVEVSEGNENLVLDVSSSTREPLRVTVRLNGEVALDVRTPAVPAQCSHSPVYSHQYRLPGDAARVSVATDRGQRRSLSVSLDDPPTWVAVQPQDGFPIGLDVFNEEPSWG